MAQPTRYHLQRCLRSLTVPTNTLSRPCPSLHRLPQCPQRRRNLTNSATRHKARTIEQVKAQQRQGPVGLYSLAFFLLCGGASYWYFQEEKARSIRKKNREASKGYGKPRIGGEFDLMTQDGERFTSEDMKGKFALVCVYPPLRRRYRCRCLRMRASSADGVDLLRVFALSGHLPRRAG